MTELEATMIVVASVSLVAFIISTAVAICCAKMCERQRLELGDAKSKSFDFERQLGYKTESVTSQAKEIAEARRFKELIIQALGCVPKEDVREEAEMLAKEILRNTKVEIVS